MLCKVRCRQVACFAGVAAGLLGAGLSLAAPSAGAPPGKAVEAHGYVALPPDTAPLPASAAFLRLLPEGEAKRKFILDCTGCHQLDSRIAFPGGQPRSEEQWEAAIRRMLGYAGATTPFPVISAERDLAATAAWLARHLQVPPAAVPPVSATADAEITEYPFPAPMDLPHDLAVDADGQIVITGMFTDRMYRLDAATGRFAEVPIPVQQANPRALEIDREGNWWVLLGAPHMVARFNPRTAEWQSWDIGMYAHDVRPDRQGRAWFNGHFSKDPELIGYVDTASGAVRTFRVPNTPELAAGGGPIPYGLRVAPDGAVWGTELHGNRIFRFSPHNEEFRTYEMPTSHSGPRRLEVDAQGILWIPEYAANKLARFDPQTEQFTEYPLPVPDALPYVAAVDPRTGRVWIGTGAADALLSFDPRVEHFTVYPLPTRGALVRHISVDPRTGNVWAAYGASPGIPPKIARLRPAKQG